ncbi:hypothetical protein DICPUDRAFT_157943 [Dictyostelium purpureum]|uniref:Uncharacterized protein n=1 Tax=Dictyostelium purpureum TaxID=5786 RepID=F1A0E9_DICPU|nr:uncharacterized protein DICPUDRAFT_157943 [Dictyostelium purpureum]EGC30320.1 hypothetical protein DICPUDRAFT_157943 [Dictyostelium purpureum]|eukprot:XP_003293143.1 hypothetical protein DICPUDRAFT_157943 [Dictyostelium purpureum]
MSSTKSITSKFEKEIEKQKEGSLGKKEKVWAPHKDDSYQKQTKTTFSGKPAAGPPPPKKSIDQLP